MHLPKRTLFIFGILLISIFLAFVIENIGSDSKSEPNSVQKFNLKDNIDKTVQLKSLPKAADNQALYKQGNFYLIEELFNSGSVTDDWNVDTDGTSATATITSGYLRLAGAGIFFEDRVYVTYKSDLLIPFHKGYLSFNYMSSGSGSLRLDINDDGSWQNNVWSGSSTSWQLVDISLNLYNTSYSDFSFRFYFVGTQSSDLIDIDNLRITTYEFYWTESKDLIEPTSNQNISVFVAPIFKGFDKNNVTLKYKVNNNDFSSGTHSINLMDPGVGKNFTFIISKQNYTSSDTFYYQIWITNTSHTVYHHTPTSSFKCEDRAAPSISNIQTNGTAKYYKDILVKCNISDNANGVGIKNATMYIKNGTIGDITKSNILIHSNRSGPIPWSNGYFGFTIPHIFLSARSNEQLEYCICAIDVNNNEANSTDQLLSISDDLAPAATYYDDNASQPLSQIGCYEALKVNYSIIEPRDGVGLKSANLLVKIGNSPPYSANDYMFSVTPIETVASVGLSGGVFNFVIGTQFRSYNEKIYCFINATDLSNNQYLNRSDYREYMIVGCLEPEPEPKPEPEPDDPSGTETSNAEEKLFTTLFVIGLMAAIGSGAIASLYIARKYLANKNREDLYSRLDAKKINIQSEIQLGDSVPKVEKPQQWTAIKTSSPQKQENVIKEEETILAPEIYWANKIGKLTAIAVQFELENNFVIPSTIYPMLGRIAKRLDDEELIKILSSKFTELFQKLND